MGRGEGAEFTAAVVGQGKPPIRDPNIWVSLRNRTEEPQIQSIETQPPGLERPPDSGGQEASRHPHTIPCRPQPGSTAPTPHCSFQMPSLLALALPLLGSLVHLAPGES